MLKPANNLIHIDNLGGPRTYAGPPTQQTIGGMRTDRGGLLKDLADAPTQVNANPKHRSKVHRLTMKLLRCLQPLRRVRTRTPLSVASSGSVRRVLSMSGAGDTASSRLSLNRFGSTVCGSAVWSRTTVDSTGAANGTADHRGKPPTTKKGRRNRRRQQ